MMIMMMMMMMMTMMTAKMMHDDDGWLQLTWKMTSAENGLKIFDKVV